MQFELPMRITILVIPGSTLMTVASVLDPLRAANRLSQHPAFEWQLVSLDQPTIALSGGLHFPVEHLFDGRESGDMLIVIASFDHQNHAQRNLIATLRRCVSNFPIVCGVEAGTWLLGRAGLIDGLEVTTHWEDLEDLQQAYPNSDVSDARFIAEGRVWSCGGASPAFDMMLHLIERNCTPQLAIEVASVFVYDQLHTASDRQPTTSLGSLERDQPKLAAAIRMMEKSVDSPVTTAAIAKKLSIATKTLESLFQRRLRTTPGAYFLDLRLQMARKLVRDTRLSMQDIAVRSGFGSQSAFSRAFKRAFGESPLNCRQRGL
ncbi:MAG: GlxA family transcriptional regulator [Rhizobiaceae bacterium]